LLLLLLLTMMTDGAATGMTGTMGVRVVVITFILLALDLRQHKTIIIRIRRPPPPPTTAPIRILSRLVKPLGAVVGLTLKTARRKVVGSTANYGVVRFLVLKEFEVFTIYSLDGEGVCGKHLKGDLRSMAGASRTHGWKGPRVSIGHNGASKIGALESRCGSLAACVMAKSYSDQNEKDNDRLHGFGTKVLLEFCSEKDGGEKVK